MPTEGEADFLRETLGGFVEDARRRLAAPADAYIEIRWHPVEGFSLRMLVPPKRRGSVPGWWSGDPAEDPSDAVDNFVEAVKAHRYVADPNGPRRLD